MVFHDAVRCGAVRCGEVGEAYLLFECECECECECDTTWPWDTDPRPVGTVLSPLLVSTQQCPSCMGTLCDALLCAALGGMCLPPHSLLTQWVGDLSSTRREGVLQIDPGELHGFAFQSRCK